MVFINLRMNKESLNNSFRQRTGGPGFDSQTICLVTVLGTVLGLIGASRWYKVSDREAEY
jgi:hypothetical protein